MFHVCDYRDKYRSAKGWFHFYLPLRPSVFPRLAAVVELEMLFAIDGSLDAIREMSKEYSVFFAQVVCQESPNYY